MEKNESSCSILRSLNLDDIEETLSEAYHQEGAGRPPRKPIGIFKALIVKRVKQIPSDRELYRRLWNDEDLREPENTYVLSKDNCFCFCLERFNRSSRRLFLSLFSSPTNGAIAKAVTPLLIFLDNFIKSFTSILQKN